jgi:serine/threonine protein phosphatase PrpC
MSDEQRARMRQTMDLVLSAPSSLEITAGDSSVTLVTEGDRLVLTTDGHKVRREARAEGEGAVDIKARWQGNDLVVERSVSGGGKVSEDYLRSVDGKQLYVIVNFDGGRGRSITFRRIYDPGE